MRRLEQGCSREEPRPLEPPPGSETSVHRTVAIMTDAIDRPSVWCIVLSDGDRSHLSPLNRLDARQVPIQYCCIGERITLLQQTLQRARRISGSTKLIV